MPNDIEERRNLRLTAGDSKTIRVDTDLDLSGATVRYAVAEQRGDQPVITKRTGQTGLTITNPTQGIFEIYLTPSDTSGRLGELWHEAEVEDGNGNITTVFTGAFIVRKNTAN